MVRGRSHQDQFVLIREHISVPDDCASPRACAGGAPASPGWTSTARGTRASSRAAHVARRFRSMSCRIIGVKMSCIASSILPPGTTIEFGRDMKESCSIESR